MELENLVLNPTLSDLAGGIHTVTLSDEEARRRHTSKTITERRGPPTFDSVVDPFLVPPASGVAVARAIVTDPALVLADEPTGNLHCAQGKEIMELFRTLNEGGATIVQVTHSEVNASYGTRSIQLRDGWVVDD